MTSTSDRLMHLLGFGIFSPMSHCVGSWKHPLDNKSEYHWARPEVWQQIARDCERGKLDAFFFADQWSAYGVYKASTDYAIKHAVQFPIHDPTLLIPMMAAVTRNLGFATTLSATYYPPYMAARKFTTLDWLTNGRIAWNIVTSFHAGEAENFGLEDLIKHGDRYARAHEYMDVCMKLWNSWDDDAIIMDTDTGIFADPAKVHPINHSGDHFRVPGFSPAIPGPQHHPVLFQAGSSPDGRDFCTRWAEASFSIVIGTDQKRAFIEDMDNRLLKWDRKPGDLKYLFGIQPIVALSEAEAKEKQAMTNELTPYEGAATVLSGHTGTDFSEFDPDQIATELPERRGISGIWESVTNLNKGSPGDGDGALTIREGTKLYGQSILMDQIVGNPQQVADQLIATWEESGCDGFLCTSTYTPGSFTEFSDMVIPVLQKYGLSRRQYTGKTLRENLNQNTPE
jgi:FMN-dependent oxidoreductase (nitrilotriacetate monooxygenase family)